MRASTTPTLLPTEMDSPARGSPPSTVLGIMSLLPPLVPLPEVLCRLPAPALAAGWYSPITPLLPRITPDRAAIRSLLFRSTQRPPSTPQRLHLLFPGTVPRAEFLSWIPPAHSR